LPSAELPFRQTKKRKGSLLLLIVDPSAVHLLACRIRRSGSQSAPLAIRGDDNLTGYGYFSVFLDRQPQRVSVDLLISPHIGSGIASNRIVFPIEFPCPLVIGRAINLTCIAKSPNDHFGPSNGDIAAGQSANTGWSQGEVATKGDFALFTCPVGSKAVDANTNQAISNPNATYHCKKQ
jgi:hypothetical protein